jgi:hypothetical protein
MTPPITWKRFGLDLKLATVSRIWFYFRLDSALILKLATVSKISALILKWLESKYRSPLNQGGNWSIKAEKSGQYGNQGGIKAELFDTVVNFILNP